MFESIVGQELFDMLRDYEAIGEPVEFVLNDKGLRTLFSYDPSLAIKVEGYRSLYEPDMGTKEYSGRGCFPGDMRITLATGKKTPLADLRVGAQVSALSTRGKRATSRVTSITVLRKPTISINNSIRVTVTQPMLQCDGRWVEAGHIEPHTPLHQFMGKGLPVRVVKASGKNEVVYSIEVKPHHSYVVEGVVVHNKTKI